MLVIETNTQKVCPESPLIKFKRRSCGIVREFIAQNQSGFVEYKAANFSARFPEENAYLPVNPGDIVKVIGLKGSMLIVEPLSQSH